MKATYYIRNGRFAGKSQELRDQWDYTGSRYELHDFDVYNVKHSGSRWNAVSRNMINALEHLSGPSSKFTRPRKRLLKDRYDEDCGEIIRHKNSITLKEGGIKIMTINIEKATIPYIAPRTYYRRSNFVALVIDRLLSSDHTGDESNSDIENTLAYRFWTSDDPVKGRNLKLYRMLHLPNSDLPSRDGFYYPMYDTSGNLWYYSPNKNGGGTVRLSADQLISTLKLCYPDQRYGTYKCQDLKQMHSNFDNDNTYLAGGKRVGPSTHTDGFQAIGKTVNDYYYSTPERHCYEEIVSDTIRSMYNVGELTPIPDEKLMHWQKTRKQDGQLPIGVVDRWGSKKAPLVVFKSPVEYAETDFKNEVINEIVNGTEADRAWQMARRNLKNTQTLTQDISPYFKPENVLTNLGLELKFTNKTY